MDHCNGKIMFYVTRNKNEDCDEVCIWSEKPILNEEGEYNCYEEGKEGIFNCEENIWKCMSYDLDEFEEKFGFSPECGYFQKMTITDFMLSPIERGCNDSSI
jgi:hypothetical protein